MNVNISVELAQAIVNYLSSQPFAEVHQLINAMQVQVQAGQQPDTPQDQVLEEGDDN